MSRLTRGPLLALLVAVLCALGVPSAAAAPDPSSDPAALRVLHLSPDTPSVDASVDPAVGSGPGPAAGHVLTAVRYGDVPAYSSVPAGTYTVSARAAGADPASPPVLATTVTVAAGTATTIALVGTFADLRFEVLSDELTPPAGGSRVRVVNAASTGSPLDLFLADRTLATDLPFPAGTGYVDVPGGDGDLTVTTASGEPTRLPVTLDAGSVYTVLVLDRSDGGLTVATALDAASPGVVPVGGVEAGAGGAGDRDLPLVRLASVALAVAALLLTVRVRLSGRERPTRHAVR
jgi:hypothetical protein